MKQRRLYQYVNRTYVGSILTAWPMLRVVRELRKLYKWHGYTSWEVRTEDDSQIVSIP